MLPFVKKGQGEISLNPLSRRLPNEWEFSTPRGVGKPGGRQGAATRGGCISSNQQLTALVPLSGKALTASSYPTFFWSLPPTSAKKVEFILEDENDNEIYVTEYLLEELDSETDSTNRIIGLTLPKFAGLKPLETGKEYHWKLTLICDLSESTGINVEATIQRVELDPILARQIQEATPEERVTIYAKERLWNETLTTLFELRRSNPNDPELAAAWQKLLNSVQLQTVAQKTLPDDTISE
ncbi:MAG: DUF928 domain-containing protein [Moorea sp. SIO2B7]|nr:DUF928 domain-containing protein [Moorena sp. SIO2B7]